MAGQNMRDAWRGKIASLCLALLVAVGLFTPGLAAVPDAQDQVRGFYGVLLGTMRDGRTLGESGRYARLAPAVDRTFDIPTMTRLAIGPAWGTLSPTQQQQLLGAFAHYIAATYADRFDTYSGEQLQVTGERPNGNEVMVQTKIAKSNGEATQTRLPDAPGSGLLADLRRVSRRHDQPTGGTSIGIPFDPAAGGRRRSRDGAEPEGRPAAERRSVVIAANLRCFRCPSSAR